MKRRQILFSAGTLAATAVTIGTGAFTRVTAERAVNVNVADDDSAFLALDPIPNPGIDDEDTVRAYTRADDTVMFSIPGNGSGENQEAEGVGVDSVYEFHDLLQIANQGTQPVELYSRYNGDAFADIALVRDNGVLRDDPPELETGDSLNVGLYIDTHGSTTGEYNEELTIIAKAPDE